MERERERGREEGDRDGWMERGMNEWVDGQNEERAKH